MAGVSITLKGNFEKLNELDQKTRQTGESMRKTFAQVRKEMQDADRAAAFNGMKAGAAGAAAGIAALAAVTKGAQAILSNYAPYDGMIRSLKTLEGTAEATEARIAKLRDVAKVPGLGFDEAVQADIRLRAVGLSAEDSEAAIRAVGNALATVGGGKAQLDGVVLGLSQIAAKGKISAEEINQIAERLPQVRAAMQSAFGSADAEVIQKSGIGAMDFIRQLVEELGKLPKVTGGAQNELENMGDAFDSLKVKASEFGVQIAGSWLSDVTNSFIMAGKQLDWLKQKMGIKTPGLQGPDGMTEEQRQSEAAADAEDKRTSNNAGVDLHNDNLDFWTRIEDEKQAALSKRAEAERKLAEEKAAADAVEADRTAKSRADASEEYRLERDILAARLKGDDERLAKLEREKAIREEMRRLEGAGFTADESRPAAERKVDLAREVEAKKEKEATTTTTRKELEAKLAAKRGEMDNLRYESSVGSVGSMQRIGGGGGAVASGLDYQRQATDLQRETNQILRELAANSRAALDA
jgi:tape measure domain-containing protein